MNENPILELIKKLQKRMDDFEAQQAQTQKVVSDLQRENAAIKREIENHEGWIANLRT